MSDSLQPHGLQHTCLPVLHCLPEFAQTHVHRVGNQWIAIQPSYPLLSFLLLPSILPSIRVFSNESTLRMRWPKYWSFSFTTTIQISSFHMLPRICSRPFKLCFSSMWTKNFQLYKLDLGKGRRTRDQIANICWIIEKAREFRKNIPFCLIDYMKVFEDHNRL